MNQYKYKIYYEYIGKTKSDPFASEKSKENITESLNQFIRDFKFNFNDEKALIEMSEIEKNSITLSVNSEKNENDFTIALTKALTLNSLFGEKTI